MTTLAHSDSAEPSRLLFTPPPQWMRTVDPLSRLVTFIPPGGNAGITFLASREFAGDREAWRDAMWQTVQAEMQLLTEPQSGAHGDFLTRTGVFQHPNGAQPWLCVFTLTHAGHGEAVVFFAASDTIFMSHLPAVHAMVRGMTAAPAAPPPPAPASHARHGATEASAPAAVPPQKTAPVEPPPAPAPAADSAAPGAEGIAGLYLASTRQLIFNPFGPPGSGSWEVRMEYYLLSRDGRVFRGRDLPSAPGGDINRFDYAAAQRAAPGNYGSWFARGNEIILQLGGGRETIEARRLDSGGLEIRGTRFAHSIPAR